MSENRTRKDSGLVVQASGHREFADGINVIKECFVSDRRDDAGGFLMEDWFEPGRERHATQAAYLIDDEETLLYDTLSPASTETILSELDAVLDGGDLDYLAVSHPEANHAGNAHAILEAYPEATLVAPGRGSHHDLHGMADLEGSDVRLVEDGDTLDLGENTIEFVEEMFYDHAMTIWMFERGSRTLFTSDFLGFYHMDGECLAFADEIGDGGPTDDQIALFNGYAFTWMRWVDVDATDAALDRINETYDPRFIAPAHGQVIREDATGYLERMKAIIREIVDREGDDPGVHTHQMARYSDS